MLGSYRMPRLASLVICVVTLAAFHPGSVLGQKAACPGATRCPAVAGPYPKPQCTINSFADSKGGLWKFSCTNQAATGDFVWQYDAPGAKAEKEIGRCVYFQGRNRHGYVRDPNNRRQVLSYWHVVQNTKNHRVVGGRKSSQPGNERTWHKFDKTLNKGVEFKESLDKATGRWSEIPNSRRQFESLTLGYNNGDPATAYAEAEYSVSLRLFATPTSGNESEIRWSSYEGVGDDPPSPIPLLRPGDTVYMDGLSLADVSSYDPRYSAADSPPGIELTAMEPVALNTGDLLATVHAGVEGLYYATNIVGAYSYFVAVFNGAPIEDELENTPLYAATAGTIDLAEPPTPTLLSLFRAQPVSGGLELRWQLGDRGRAAEVRLDRAETASGPWARAEVERRDEGSLAVALDRGVTPGLTYYYRLVATMPDGEVIIFGPLSATAGTSLVAFELARIAPNPSLGPTWVEFTVPREARVRLSILDVQGRELAVLAEGVHPPGRYQATWSGRTDRGEVPPGLYFVRYQSPGGATVSRLAMTR